MVNILSHKVCPYCTFYRVILCIRCSTARPCSTVINQTQLKQGGGKQGDKTLSHSTIHFHVQKRWKDYGGEFHKRRHIASFHSTNINN